MKRIFKLIIILTTVFVFGIKGVKADSVNVVKEYVDNVWSFHYRNGSMWTFGNLQKDYADGTLVYCIQPDASLNTSDYYSYDNFDITGYSEYDKNQMELISYYGYGYPEHDSLRYFMATQELLWLFSPDEWITWNTSEYNDGENIDISYEKNEIMRLVNNHNKKPSFYQEEIVSEIDSISLYDENGVLDNYDIEVDENLSYERDGNRITFYSDKKGKFNVRFTKKRYLSSRTLAFNNEDIWTQKLALFGEPYFEDFSITLDYKVNGIINIYKQNEEGEYLSGVKFDIYDEEENIVDEVETIDGIASSKELELGNYKVKEVENIYGYEPNDTIYEVNLSYNDQDASIVIENLYVINNRIKCEIVLITTSDEENLDTEFNIYDKDMNLIYSGETINGRAEISLPYGDYILKEIGVPDGYLLNEEEIKFSVNDITCASNFRIDNEKVYMPDTTTSSNISYLILFIINLTSYAYYKKNQ